MQLAKIKLFLFLLCIAPTSKAYSQNLVQTIRGKIIDEDSRTPAIGATVVVIGSDPILGAITDIDGYFTIEKVSIGRVDLNVTYIGYEPKVIPNVIVDSGKEVFLNIEILENIEQLKAVEIVGNSDKTAVHNEMQLISARAFSVEETERYAGSFSDPARMVVNYAGVSGDPNGNNDIIVRGNSPKGILWRLDGIEIPNPNHFSFEGGSGGGINALNSTMLTDSDFLTGAFSPEYGNATSGVFDIKLRQGNNEEHEYSLGVGILGVDFAAEGPFKKGSKGSYLINYRYSSLDLLDQAGLVSFEGVPKFQDLSFKLHLPTKNAGTFSMFGLGGLSSIVEETKSDDQETLLSTTTFEGELGAIGLNHTYLLNSQTYFRTSLSFTENGSGWKDSDLWSDNILTPTSDSRFQRYNTKAFSTFNKKLNSKNRITTGAGITFMNYNFNWKVTNENEPLENKISEDDKSSYFQTYFSWKHRFTENLSIVSGLHFIYFNLNSTYSIEPRIASSWSISEKQTLSIGFGVHSRIESLINYTVNVTDNQGNITQPNKELEIPKSIHYVIGYDYKFSRKAHIKLEAYYQNLYDIGVENDIESAFSLINQIDGYDDKALVSKGRGFNYGIELTLERFFADNFYYLLTGSVFESKYNTLDKIWRKGRFSSRYNTNFLVGKEFRVGDSHKNKSISIDLKFTLLGGARYTPINEQQSIIEDQEVLYDDQPFEAQGDDIFITNISARYKKNNPKATHIIQLEILNATNNDAVTGEYYDSDLNRVVTNTQLELIPNLMYRLQF